MILDDRPDLRVLMLQRSPGLVFAASAWAFPGGRVDPADATARADELVAGRSDAEASAALGLRGGGIAHWVAAIRETFEEAGVILAADPAAARGAFGPPEHVAEIRRAVAAGERRFVDVIADAGLHLDGAGVHYVARWITPIGPPRRFDARFFVAAMPAGQVPRHDGSEAVDHRWVAPTEALAANASGDMEMVLPQQAMLARLARFDSAAAAVEAAAGARPDDDEEVRLVLGEQPGARVVFPDDPAYDVARADIERGTVRWPASASTPGRRQGD